MKNMGIEKQNQIIQTSFVRSKAWIPPLYEYEVIYEVMSQLYQDSGYTMVSATYEK